MEAEQHSPKVPVRDRDLHSQIVPAPSLSAETPSAGVPNQQLLPASTDNEFQNRITRRLPEAVDRFFLDRGDLCSESEIIKECEALNGRIETLVFNLQDGWETQRKAGGSRNGRNQTGKTVDDFHDDLRHALGEGLLNTLKRVQPGDDEYHGCIQDAFQAWIVYTIHRSIRRTLFGIDLRSVDDLNQIYSQMHSQGEPSVSPVYIRRPS